MSNVGRFAKRCLALSMAVVVTVTSIWLSPIRSKAAELPKPVALDTVADKTKGITVYHNLSKLYESYLDLNAKETLSKIKQAAVNQNTQTTTPEETNTQPVVQVEPKTFAVGEKVTMGTLIYVLLDDGTVAVSGVTSKALKAVVIPASITVDGMDYQVSQIANNALKGCKKLKKATIGKNVTVIGNSAFAGCKLLKTIKITSAGITKVGKKAFSGIHKKAVIKVPKKQKKQYTKLMKKKGQASSVKLK